MYFIGYYLFHKHYLHASANNTSFIVCGLTKFVHLIIAFNLIIFSSDFTDHHFKSSDKKEIRKAIGVKLRNAIRQAAEQPEENLEEEEEDL